MIFKKNVSFGFDEDVEGQFVNFIRLNTLHRRKEVSLCAHKKGARFWLQHMDSGAIVKSEFCDWKVLKAKLVILFNILSNHYFIELLSSSFQHEVIA